jgi:two-component system, cell cycle sensor histidine kinase and response regulator CckA
MEAGKAHVLVVDDDAQIAKMVEMMLTQGGYLVTRMEESVKALLWAIDEGTRIDLMITDVVMPVVTGPELADAVRTKHPEIPVIYMSGSDKVTVSKLGMQGRTRWLLEKPFKQEELLRYVTAALGGEEQTESVEGHRQPGPDLGS